MSNISNRSVIVKSFSRNVKEKDVDKVFNWYTFNEFVPSEPREYFSQARHLSIGKHKIQHILLFPIIIEQY